jgi:ornithine cyclodeaminase
VRRKHFYKEVKRNIMTRVVNKHEIVDILKQIDITTQLKAIEDGYVAYSEKKVVVPPVGHLGFQNPPGDVHIKYGAIQHDKYYVIKIASSFYENPHLNLSSSNGLMLVFSQKTGELLSILLDEGYLTDIRTALAGAVVSKHLAPEKITNIGIVGTGIQARLQLQYLQSITDCRTAYVWGRSKENLDKYLQDMKDSGFAITATENIDDITSNCNLIITTTPSKQPLLLADQIQPGTHITAMGADSKGKQELDPKIFQKADIILADSIAQCVDHGDISHAIEAKLLDESKIVALGTFIKQGLHRENNQQITVTDLTGVAIQDIQIAKIVYESIL